MRMWKIAAATGLATMTAIGAAQAQVKVGIITSLSGPAASIGVPYAKGYAAWQAGGTDVAGQKLTIIQIDDASDPSVGARAAKKLIEEDKVDAIVGSAGAPTSLAIYGVAAEAKVPMIITANALVPGERGNWEITVPQPAPLMISADVEQMKKAGIKTIGYIGYSDAWGDLVYDSLVKVVEPQGIKVISNERYARADTSVTPQILKIIAARPDAVFTGGSGSPGALPHLALAERGYRGHVYSTHAIINSEFVRVGGAAVEGMIAPTGPVVVAEQLPDSNPIKAVALRFRALYEEANNEKSNDAFAAYGYDALVILADAVKRTANGPTKPGTPEYRAALRDALVTTQDLVGTHAVYNFKPGERYGTDERSRVLVRLDHGAWKLVQ
ncbi:ABC transporter substrate-binding protein [Limobrevibacterium gyesilva]|uniref:ABC transporter substrate-binding protein n=1 Tax=Limobrevibacterium gyesilva TaxID=2991712 RepID=A0AA42CG08_9PROT|nr:ABC transporter substrate-binding protein [Limobrevibacterium gyesilva]MCW3473537.1 ABC transporter substrate-binding protein [Limobrevibacterium gyesilva]